MKALSFAASILMAAAAVAGVQVEWSTLGNRLDSDGRPVYTQRFTVAGGDSIDGFCFSQFARRMRPATQGDTIIEIVPGYYCVKSTRFGADTVVIDIVTAGSLRSICYAPDGVHGLRKGQVVDVDFTRADITAEPSQWVSARGEDVMPYGDAAYRRNAALQTDGAVGFYDAVPSFKSVKMTREAAARIRKIKYRSLASAPRQGYWRAVVNNGTVTVEAAAADMPLAKRRLAAIGLKKGVTAPGAVIEDWPDFPYRGIMIDISRNYQTPAEMDRILRLMSVYGLNVLHFHFADDEAWRLEIPGLPELTEVGGRRGYTLDEHDHMAQIFAGSGRPDTPAGTANGFFTRSEFVDMLRTAASLGIEVIPEVESPGHARAAIKAMERRYRVGGDDTYRLIDPADTSVYTSAQSFHDNVMNPVLPGPVRFMTHVARELKAMYADAGVTMPALHIGGDEVAKGAWTGSPVARAYMDSVGMTDERLLHLKFVTELLAELRALSIPVSGWQEIAVGHDEAYNEAVRPYVHSVNCWSTLGNQNSVTARSARAGYPTVLSNVDHYYLDMCYTPHPYERGLSWGGYVDEFDALDGYPRNLCKVDSADFANVIGISGQLFSETIRSAEMLETFLLPKMLGLAERAWNADSTYSRERFNAVVNTRELPRWQRLGYGFHVAQPGIMAAPGGKVVMNTQYPASVGAEVRYTLDGSEPTAQSALYTDPVSVTGAKQVRAAAYIGKRRSVTSILYLQLPQ